MRIKWLSLMLAVTLLSSCASFMEDVRESPPTKSILEGQPSLSIVVPVSSDIIGNGTAISPLRYEGESQGLGTRTSLRTEVNFETGKGDFYVVQKMTAGNEVSTSYVMILFDLRRETSGDTQTFTFTPKAVEQKKGIGTRIPQFAPTDAISYLRKTVVSLKFDIDSQYDTDAVFSNFKRKHGASFRETRGDDPKSRKGRLSALAGNDSYVCNVQTWPYKGGSKTTVALEFKVSGYRENGDRVDLTERLKALKDSLAAVVNG